jgi:thioredoxin 1
MSSEHGRSFSEGKELESMRQKRMSELKGKKEMIGKPVHVTDSNFKELTANHALALVDFWAAWCGPCQSLAPTIEEVAKEYEGKVFVGKLNVDENPQTAECFQVFSIPTMVIMKDGKEVDRIVGCVQKKYIEETLEKHFKQV